MITGCGVVSPFGNTARETWAAFSADARGERSVAAVMDASSLKARLPDRRLVRLLSPRGVFGVIAAAEALGDAAPLDLHEPQRRGVAVATQGDLPALAPLLDRVRDCSPVRGWRIPPWAPQEFITSHRNSGIGAIAGLGTCRGPMLSVENPGAGSIQAIGEGMRIIQDGDADLMLVGGFAAISEPDVLVHHMLETLGEGSAASLSEGAVFLVLEERSGATGRGCCIQAQLVGYGTAAPECRGAEAASAAAALAARRALDDAGLAPEEVRKIVTGAGVDNLAMEAIRSLFEQNQPCIVRRSAHSTGHMLSADGAFATFIGARCLQSDPGAVLVVAPGFGRAASAALVLASSGAVDA